MVVAQASWSRSLQLVLFQVGEHFGRELASASRVVDLENTAALVDEKGDSPRAGRAAVWRCTVVHGHLHVGVGEQREGEVVVLRELGVRRDGVVRAAENLDVLRREVATQALKGPPLRGSSTGARPRIKPEQQLLTSVVLQRDASARVRSRREVWRRVANFERAARGEKDREQHA